VSDNITVAFAGPADATIEATKALLNDYLGFGPEDADGFPEPSDRDIELIFPLHDNLPKGLENVLLWSEYADLPFTAVLDEAKSLDDDALILRPDDTIKVANVNAKIVDMLSHATGEGVLVLLWGEGDDAGDDETEALLDLALAEGIKVLDLTAGLDDITFSEAEPEPEPEPEPKPARRSRRGAAASEPAPAEESTPQEEKPARRGRARKTEEPLVQEEEALVDEPVAEEPVKPARRSRKTKEPEATTEEATKDFHDRLAEAKAAVGLEGVETPDDAVVSVNPVGDSLDLIKGTLSSVYLYLSKEAETDSLLMLDEKTDETPLAEAVREALEALEGVATVTKDARVGEPKRGRGRPKKEPSDDDTSAYFEDGDGIIRAATRGRPRRGETRVELTEAQFEEKNKAGLVDDDA